MEETVSAQLRIFYAVSQSFLARVRLESSDIAKCPFGETEKAWCSVFYPELSALCTRQDQNTLPTLLPTQAAHSLAQEIKHTPPKSVTNDASRLVNLARSIVFFTRKQFWVDKNGQWLPTKDNEDVIDNITNQYNDCLELAQTREWYRNRATGGVSAEDPWRMLVRAAPVAYSVLALLEYLVLREAANTSNQQLAVENTTALQMTGCKPENLQYHSYCPPTIVVTNAEHAALIRDSVRVLVAARCKAHLDFATNSIEHLLPFLWVPTTDRTIKLRAPANTSDESTTEFIARGLFPTCDWVPWAFYHAIPWEKPLAPAPSCPQDTARIRAKLLDLGASKSNERKSLVSALETKATWDDEGSINALAALHSVGLAVAEVTDITSGTTALTRNMQNYESVVVVVVVPNNAWPGARGTSVKTTQEFFPTQRAILLRKNKGPTFNKDYFWLQPATATEDE